MMIIKYFSLMLILSSQLSYGRDNRPYISNATAVVNLEGVILKSSNEVKVPTKEQLIAKSKEMYSEAVSNSFAYNNTEEINAFLDFIKKNKIEDAFKAQFQYEIPALKDRAKYETEWKMYKEMVFSNSKSLGLLDQDEYETMKNKIILLQKERANKSKRPEWAKDDLKLITAFEKKYLELRPLQIESNKQLCEKEIDWSENFSKRKGQTDTGWCYAFAYADYIESQYRQSVSSADLVLLYRQYKMQQERKEYNKKAELYNRPKLNENEFLPYDYIYKGGEHDKIFYKKPLMSLCSEADLKSEAKDKFGQPVSMGLVIEWINEIGDDYKKGLLDKKSLIAKLENFNYREIFPNAKLENVIKKLTDNKDLYILLADSTCEDKRIELQNDKTDWIFQGSTFTYSMAHNNDDIAALLEKAPVLISVNDNFLWKENIWGKGYKSNHVILVTGKRWNNKTNHCEFKIRNSQTVHSDEQEKVWYLDTELLRNLTSIYIEVNKAL